MMFVEIPEICRGASRLVNQRVNDYNARSERFRADVAAHVRT